MSARRAAPPAVAMTPLEVKSIAHPDEDTWTLRFAWPRNPLPMNGAKGNLYGRARTVRQVRELAGYLAKIARIPPLGYCRVQLTWWVASTRTRDVDNLAALEKPIFDGLVDAGIVPDDNPRYMDKPRGIIRHIDDSNGALTRPCFTLTITRIGVDL